MARGMGKQNFLKDSQKKAQREQERQEQKQDKNGSRKRPPRSKSLERRSYACGAVVAVIFGILLLLCFPHTSPPEEITALNATASASASADASADAESAKASEIGPGA
mmetsp:Transcript_86861/g.181832  ORF Transcript_86861/g.181832 Transcript_86861/m.181832 type:complete len:108 (+) Transcript_86861:313-636(+)